MRVPLRRRKRRMPQLLLDGPKVSPRRKHVGRAGMSKSMRMNPRNPSRGPRIRDDPTRRPARQAPAPMISEERRRTIGSFGTQSPNQDIECGCRRWSEGHDAGLAPLARSNPDEALVYRDIRPVERHRLGHPQPCPVQQLEQGPVAQLQEPVLRWMLHHRVSFWYLQDPRHRLRDPRPAQGRRRVDLQQAFGMRPSKKTPKRGHPASQTRGCRPGSRRPETRQPSPKLATIHLCQSEASCGQVGLQISQIRGVSPHGMPRSAPVPLEVVQPFSHKRMHSTVTG